MKNEKLVKLVFYQLVNNEIVIDSIQAKDWGDFIVVRIKTPSQQWIDNEPFIEALKEFSNRTKKEVLLIPHDWDIQFYGIEAENDEPQTTN